jgi:hypothetical protein
MSELDLLLNEYEESLHAFGHADPIVVVLKRELLGYGIKDINDLVRDIDNMFDTLVFNGQMDLF